MSMLKGVLSKSRTLLKTQNAMCNSVRFENVKLNQATHKVNNLEKKFLVWTGKYKTVDEVPAFVQQNVVERARNRMRIRISNYMMAATAVGCVLMVIYGKKQAAKGESVTKQNLEWHRQFEEAENKKTTPAA